MEFTGERFVPTLQGDIRLEHFHRYEWCLPFVHGKRVLDIACGEGYGSHILARTAASVIGVDISQEAVEHAGREYGDNDKIEFRQGDAAEIPLPDQCVDVVVSFETIEHHDRHVEMMSEIRRVLTPDGLLIISSPNKKIYSDLAGGAHNHFHVKELYFSELDELLRQYFSEVSYFGQRFTATSLLQPLDDPNAATSLSAYTETADGVTKANPYRIEPMYYVAVAANRELPQLPGATAFFTEIDNPFYEKQREVVELSAEIRRMSDYIAEVNEVVRIRDDDIAEYRRVLAELEVDLGALKRNREELSHNLEETSRNLAETARISGEQRQALDTITRSRSWRAIQAVKKILGRR